MTQTENIRRVYRLCPCGAMDIEGIQTWLEDLAAKGFILESDGIFCGFWSFLPAPPQKVQYRLEAVRRKMGDDTDAPREEMLETAEAMGWEYVARYKFFYIYRCADLQPRPFHSDPAIHAITIKALRRQQYTDLIFTVILLLLEFCLYRSRFGFLFRDALTVGPLYAICCLSFFIGLLIPPILRIRKLHQWIQKLKAGENLDSRKDWKPAALRNISLRAVLPILATICACCLLSAWVTASESTPLVTFRTDAPFATIEEAFPEGNVTNRTDMGDYNTTLTWSNLISTNTEWEEAGDITIAGKSCYFILRVTCHETAAPWLARMAAQDYYAAEADRYNGKRFEALDAPDVEVDGIWMYTSYGIRYILLQHGSTLIHATVTVSEGQTTDLWEQWLSATVEKLNLQS